jgi:hypothetical protein
MAWTIGRVMMIVLLTMKTTNVLVQERKRKTHMPGKYTWNKKVEMVSSKIGNNTYTLSVGNHTGVITWNPSTSFVAEHFNTIESAEARILASDKSLYDFKSLSGVVTVTIAGASLPLVSISPILDVGGKHVKESYVVQNKAMLEPFEIKDNYATLSSLEDAIDQAMRWLGDCLLPSIKWTTKESYTLKHNGFVYTIAKANNWYYINPSGKITGSSRFIDIELAQRHVEAFIEKITWIVGDNEYESWVARKNSKRVEICARFWGDFTESYVLNGIDENHFKTTDGLPYWKVLAESSCPMKLKTLAEDWLNELT